MDQQKLLVEFTCDQRTGQLYRRGKKVGHMTKHGYLVVKFLGRTVFAHRIVWTITRREWPHLDIDHINGLRSDNRPENLRQVTRSMNCQNKGAALPTNSTTGLLGVNHHASNGKGFRAQIWFGGKNHHLGYYQTPEQAHAAYLTAKAEFHPGFVASRFA